MKEGNYLTGIKTDASWSFDSLTRKETSYASHGYHKYPAKFIPQLVKRLLLEYSKEGDIILDPFGGCGTTLVESRLNNRNSICIDVNDSALLITKAKSVAINPKLVEDSNKRLLHRISNKRPRKNYYKIANPRLKYWFKREQFNKLKIIFLEIEKEPNEQLRVFYECCFSNILKNCSQWYSKSIKPMQDKNKKLVEPSHAFATHLDFMTKQNSEYYNLMKTPSSTCQIRKADARKTNLPPNYVDLIITSPPYAISYEYADIHQLSLLWFNFTDDIKKTRTSYIGSSSRNTPTTVNTIHGKKMIDSLKKYDTSLANQITNYMVDLEKSFAEMYRVLRYEKYACIIIGDTKYKTVSIRNKDITIELLEKLGFTIKNVIKRKISAKIFTPYRDGSGRFSNHSGGGRSQIYQYEYIIIAKKEILNGLIVSFSKYRNSITSLLSGMKFIGHEDIQNN